MLVNKARKRFGRAFLRSPQLIIRLNLTFKNISQNQHVLFQYKAELYHHLRKRPENKVKSLASWYDGGNSIDCATFLSGLPNMTMEPR